MKNDTAPNPSLKKGGGQIFESEFSIKDEDMKTGNLYTHGTQTYKLEYYNSEKVTVWNEAEKHRHDEKRKFFQTYFKMK